MKKHLTVVSPQGTPSETALSEQSLNIGVQVSRRQWLQTVATGTALAAGAVVTGGALLQGCGSKNKELACTDLAGLSSQDRTTREQLKYVDHSPDAAKVCEGCRFWQVAPEPNSCGACTLVKGPIHPKGHCNSWVPTETS